MKSSLSKAIERVIDAEGTIRSDASDELARIRRLIGSKQREVEKAFRQVVEKYRRAGYLSDTIESQRNGRRVITVPAEHKRKIRGIIHDESATGKTAYIEPDEVIGINNDIFDYQQEEKREINRILRELSADVAPARRPHPAVSGPDRLLRPGPVESQACQEPEGRALQGCGNTQTRYPRGPPPATLPEKQKLRAKDRGV